MYEDYNSTPKNINYPLLIFVFIQILFIVVAIVSFLRLSKGDELYEDEYRTELSISIINISEKYSNFPEDNIVFLENELYDTIKKNISDSDLLNTNAEIREGTEHEQYFENENLTFYSAIIDIPSLNQSYQFFHEYSDDKYNKNISPNDSYMVLCLDDEKLITYPDFNCQSKYDSSTRDMIVSKYLPYHNFEYFSANVETKKDTTTRIAIQPISSDFSSSESRAYTKQVKDFIESLGISSERFTYDVVDPEDFTFYQETD